MTQIRINQVEGLEEILEDLKKRVKKLEESAPKYDKKLDSIEIEAEDEQEKH